MGPIIIPSKPGIIPYGHQLASGKQPHTYGKSHFFMGKSTVSMAMFSNYVKLPEGNGDLGLLAN
jgi:formylglycine-generating enzyme required for sulfatase activity